MAIALPRNPIHLAHTARDLQLLSGGRFALGLGTQTRAHITRRFGAAFDHPVDRMAEMIGALRAIFSAWQDGAPLSFEGTYHQHTLMTPVFDPGPSPWGPPPIWVGALGPRMTEMVAANADGLLIMPFNSRRHLVERTVPRIDAGLGRSGRTRADLTVVAEAIVCMGRDEAEMAAAEAGCRGLLGFYASTPSYRPVLDAEGWGDLQPELNTLSKAGRWDEMGGLIDDEMLATLTVRGTPAVVAAGLDERFGDLADHLAIYAPYGLADECLADLVDTRKATG